MNSGHDSTNIMNKASYLLPVALLLGTLSAASAQPTVPVWTNRYNGPANSFDQANAIAVDGSGNVVVTGYSYSTNGDPFFWDYATIKYSAAGEPLWTNRFNQPPNWYAEGTAVVADANGDVIVTGTFRSNSGMADRESATIKYSAAGLPLWTNYFNSGAPVLALDASGNVFVTGSNPFPGDYETIKYSSTGVPLWTNRYGGPLGGNDDDAYALAVDSGGNVVVTGFSDGANSYQDYLTVKYSAAGLPLWTNRYNGPGNDTDIANAVAVDSNGNVFVTGRVWNGGNDDYATVKYSRAGVELWVRLYNGPANYYDEATSISVDSSGNVFVTGYSFSPSAPDAYDTIKYSGAGVPLWTNRLGPGQYGVKPAMAVDGSGNVLVTGMSMTVAYSGAGVPLWTNSYPGMSGTTSLATATAMALDRSGNVFATGTWDSDYTTIKYSVPGLSPIPLNHQIIGSQLVLSWTDATFSLQSALAAQGAYTNVSGATSPYTNTLSAAQQYFRLLAN